MHMIKQDQSKVHNMDLLWRYYEKNRNFGKAAHVLARLADMHRFVHNNRIENLLIFTLMNKWQHWLLLKTLVTTCSHHSLCLSSMV